MKTVKTSCRSCHGGCGAIVHLDGDRVVKIQPDPDSPLSKGRMCIKGLKGIELLYHPDRLKYPMKRLGGRGEGKWGRITWDEAYDLIAENLQKTISQYGAEAIVIAQGTGRHMFQHVPRFANTLGTPNWIEPGMAMCFFPRVQAGMMGFGAFSVVDYYSGVNPECILVWGHNHDVTSAGGECQFFIQDAIKRGAKLIVIDPRKTPLASKAELWLRVRPGTDDALALGMLNVIINEKLFDREFVEKWTYGFEALCARVQEYPVERVSEITWIPAEQIRAAARMFAGAGTATLEWGCAIEHTPNTMQTVRAISLLMALTGNYDKPGGWYEGMNVLPSPSHNSHLLSREQSLKRLGEKEFRVMAGAHNPFPSAHIPTAYQAMLTGEPYPVRAMMLFGNNGIMSNGGAQATHEAMMSLDFISSMELFMTPTTALADVVLPAASWLELDEIYAPPDLASHTILVQKQVVRTHECKSDEEVFCELSRKMGLEYGAETPEEIYDAQLAAAARLHPQLEGLTFQKMKELSYLQIPIEFGKYEKRSGFRTPTGKVELYSTLMEKLGYDPLPYYEEPPESPYSQPLLAKDFPLILTTGGRVANFFCTEHHQIPSLRKGHPNPIVDLHPDTAREHGIADGDWVYIESPRGRITQKARLSQDMDPRVVNCEYGWWYPERETQDFGCWESNANVLTTMGPPYDPSMGTYQLRGLLCRISKNDDRDT